jgi:hypothetical protein
MKASMAASMASPSTSQTTGLMKTRRAVKPRRRLRRGSSRAMLGAYRSYQWSQPLFAGAAAGVYSAPMKVEVSTRAPTAARAAPRASARAYMADFIVGGWVGGCGEERAGAKVPLMHVGAAVRPTGATLDPGVLGDPLSDRFEGTGSVQNPDENLVLK